MKKNFRLADLPFEEALKQIQEFLKENGVNGAELDDDGEVFLYELSEVQEE